MAISLSTWFRDYLYIPLGGSKAGTARMTRNIFIIFIVSGFWHGANWTFLVWGALNAAYFLPLMLTHKNRIHLETVAQGKLLPSPREIFQMSLTFFLTVLAWVFFRAESITHALAYLNEIFSQSFFSVPSFPDSRKALIVLLLITAFLLIEWLGREQEYAIQKINVNLNKPFRYAAYYSIIAVIFWYGGEGQQFIYFQF